MHGLCNFHCNLLWYFTPLTACLKYFSFTSNSFDSPTAAATILTAWCRSCDADLSGIMSLKLTLSADRCDGLIRHTHQPSSFITGWRRPCMINQNASTGMVGINFLAVYNALTVCQWLSAIDSKHFNSHSWTSDVNIWSENAARI